MHGRGVVDGVIDNLVDGGLVPSAWEKVRKHPRASYLELVHNRLQGPEELAVFLVVLGRAIQGCREDDMDAVVGAGAEHSVGSVLVVALEQGLGRADLVLGDRRHGLGLRVGRMG